MKIKITMFIMSILFALVLCGAASAADTNTSNYTTFSNESTGATAIANDNHGNIYVTGSTSNTNFTVTNGTYKSNTTGNGDVLVCKYDSNGTLIFSTYFGGSGSDSANGITVDNQGNIYITGQTKSTDFPTTSNAYQTSLKGGADAFIVKLSNDGTTLLYSTYLGGNSADTTGSRVETGTNIKVGSNGKIYVTGQTNSVDFPTTSDAYKKNITSNSGVYYGDVFLTEFDSNGNMVYSTLLGGNNTDETPYGLAIDSQGNIWITGKTTSSDFPTTSDAYQKSIKGSYSDAFLSKFSPNGSITYSTYFGGGGNDYGYAVAIDSADNVYITGQTTSTNLPTNSTYQTARNGSGDAYVAKFNSNGSLIYCTYFGGSGMEDSRGITVDNHGSVYITGRTSSTIPTTANAIYASFMGGTYDAFITKLNSNGTALLYASLLGSTSNDFGYGVVTDNLSNVYVVGTGFALTKIATAPTVTVDPVGGLYNTTKNVTLAANDSTATIYYTTDGTDPTNSSTRITYTTPIVITNTTTLKYAAVDSLGNWSPFYSETYTIDKTAPVPKANLPIGSYNTTQTVNLSAADNMDSNPKIYYTTDGSNPTNISTPYTGPISIINTTTLKYIAVDAAGNKSPVYNQTYTIDKKAPAASASVKSGLYNTNKIVKLSMSEKGTIYYTLNGSTPTTSSKKYTGPLTINSTTTLKYIAVDAACNTSPVYTKTYTIDKKAPNVSSSSPKVSATGVSKTKVITIKFNENILKSVNWSQIYMKNLTTGKLVSINKWIKNNTLYIKMTYKRYPHNWYKIYIPKSAVKDSAGNKLTSAYKLTFKT